MLTQAFKKNDGHGFTLIELLVTVAVVALVFAVAVPVVLNITSGVKTDATSVSSNARADFSNQYFGALGASSTSDATYTYAVYKGRTLAKIRTTTVPGAPTITSYSGSCGNYENVYFTLPTGTGTITGIKVIEQRSGDNAIFYPNVWSFTQSSVTFDEFSSGVGASVRWQIIVYTANEAAPTSAWTIYNQSPTIDGTNCG